jgi:hypothetical protein
VSHHVVNYVVMTSVGFFLVIGLLFVGVLAAELFERLTLVPDRTPGEWIWVRYVMCFAALVCLAHLIGVW